MAEDKKPDRIANIGDILRSFVDNQDAEFIGDQRDVARMPMEAVVDRYHHQEAKRSRDPDLGGKAEVRIDSDRWPTQLVESLGRFAEMTAARSVATLTKCATYKMAYWFFELGLSEVVTEAKRVDSLIVTIPDPFLLSTLSESFSVRSFKLPETIEARGRLATIGWFKTMLSRCAASLGMFDYQLFSVGLEWFLSTTELVDIDPINIKRRFCRDAKLMELHITERRLYLVYIKQLAEARKAMGGDL